MRLVSFSLINIVMLFSSCVIAVESVTLSAIEGSINTIISKKVLVEAYNRVGIEVNILEFPAKRSARESNAGHVDGELYRVEGIEETYENLIMVSVPVNVLEAMVFTKQTNLLVDGWQSIRPYTIGKRTGVWFSDEGTTGMKTYDLGTNEQLFNYLNKNRAEIVITAKLNGLATIKNGKLGKIKMLTPPIASYPLYHYLHKSNYELIPIITTSLRAMEQEGRIKQIREQYVRNNF